MIFKKLISAIFPILFLILGLGFSLFFWDGDILNGPGQSILIISAFLAFLPQFGKNIREYGFNHTTTKLYIKHFYLKIWESIKNVSIAIWILFLVGGLIASWSMSGIIPGLILMGLDHIHPDFFLAGACISSAIVSIVSGSSWSTAGTIGIAFMGVGEIWNFHPGMVAGAILSGAYFGDKLSPLSDTTNLASGVAKISLSSHIRFMIPMAMVSFFLSLLVLAIMGWGHSIDGISGLEIHALLSEEFSMNFWIILIPTIVLVSVGLGLPAIPSLGMGVISGLALGIGQRDISWFHGIETIAMGYKSNLGYADLDSILSGGGISAMLPTVFLILSAMVFGGSMEASGKMDTILEVLMKKVQTPGRLVLHTMGFSFFTNLTSSDQYLSVVIPGRTLRNAYDKMEVDRKYLSRALEDSGTISSVLIPWNSCGAFMSTTLGIATPEYFFFCIFHWIHILLSINMALLMDNEKWKIYTDRTFLRNFLR